MNKIFFVISFSVFLIPFGNVFAANSDGTVNSFQKISESQGGLTGNPLSEADRFGWSAASIGDFNNDGVEDVAVGAPRDDAQHGAVYILYLKTDGTVDSFQVISDTDGGFDGENSNGDFLGSSIANMGDLDGDGVTDLAVGAFAFDGGELSTGAVWILFMKTDGTVKSEQLISSSSGGFNEPLDNSDRFGVSVANIGDYDLNGVNDLAVGTSQDDDGGRDRGAVWILFLNSDGTVKSKQKISDLEGNFNGVLDNNDFFGHSVANIGDLNDDGVTDLAVGAMADDDGGNARGAVWILFMNADGTVNSFQKISATEGGFGGAFVEFGWSVYNMGDLNCDGITDIVVGSLRDGGVGKGSVYILFLNNDGTVNAEQKISHLEGGFGPLDNSDFFGSSATKIMDLNGDGVPELIVGAQSDDDGNRDAGAVWVLFLKKIGECPTPVGGELIPLDTTSLLLAGTYSTAAWMIPVLVSGVGIGFVIFRRYRNSVN